MTFNQLLLIFTLTLFIILSIILIQTYKKGKSEKKQIKLPNFSFYHLVLILLLAYTAYYLIIGTRSIIWFSVFSIYMTLSLFYSLSERTSQRNFVIVTVLLMAIILSIIPIAENQGIIFGPDQWRDLKITSFIINEGTSQGAISGGYYAALPLFNLINAVLTIVPGWQAISTLMMVDALYSMISILSIYLVVEKLSRNSQTALLGIGLFVATPRLTTIQAIPAVASMALGTLLLLFVIDEKIQTKALYVAPMIAFTTTVIHPIGIIPIMTILVGMLILGRIYPEYRLPSKSQSYLSAIFAMIIVVTLIFWSLDPRILQGVTTPIRRLVDILTNFTYKPSVYSSQYETSGSLIFSFSWALPVSLTMAYLLTFLLYERKIGKVHRELAEYFGPTSAFIGLAILFASFVSTILSPGASLERYLSVPAYTLMIYPAVSVLQKILSINKKLFSGLILAIILVNINIGSFSPDWAPFENPAFGAYRSTFKGYQEANRIIASLPDEIRIYEDNDLPVVEVANIRNMNVTRDGSYQTIRAIINKFKENTISTDLYNYQTVKNSYIFIKNFEITTASSKNLFNNTRIPINIGFNSGYHLSIKIS
jgi:hypothetical protein